VGEEALLEVHGALARHPDLADPGALEGLGGPGGRVEGGAAVPGGGQGGRIAVADGGAHVGADLIAAPADGRADQAGAGRRVGPEPGHGRDPGLDHPGGQAAPAGMDRADHPGRRVGQQHRSAVGGQHGQHHPGLGGDQPIGLAHDRPALGRPLPEPAGVDPEDGRGVDLPGQGPGLAGQAEDGGGPAPVGEGPAQVVTDPQGKVEGVVGGRRGPAGPAGEGGHHPGLEEVLGHQHRRPGRLRLPGDRRPRPPDQPGRGRVGSGAPARSLGWLPVSA